MTGILEGLKILVLEDEALIAMDVEQLCRDHGASDVALAHSLDEIAGELQFDAAVIDMFLNGISTLDFADGLKTAGKPFVFASGHTDSPELTARFPGVMLVGKPYAGNDLVAAIAMACGRIPREAAI